MARPKLTVEELEQRISTHQLLIILHERTIKSTLKALRHSRREYFKYSAKLKQTLLLNQAKSSNTSDVSVETKKTNKKRVVEV